MKRRLMAFLLAGALVASNVTPAFAADVAEDYDVVVYEDETAPDEEDAGAADDLAGDVDEEIIDAVDDGAEDLGAPADDAGYEEETSFDAPEDAAPVEEGEEEEEELAGEEEELHAADDLILCKAGEIGLIFIISLCRCVIRGDRRFSDITALAGSLRDSVAVDVIFQISGKGVQHGAGSDRADEHDDAQHNRERARAEV